MLEGKKILFLSVNFFNYQNIIKEQLQDLGAIVDYYDERPSNTIWVKGVIRLKKEIYQRKINNYYKEILRKIKNESYHYFLLIKGEVVPAFFIEEIKKKHPQMICIYYNWDSFENNPNAQSIIHLFDKKFTFDKKDAQEYGMNFRPLFYSKEYHELKKHKDEMQYHLMFIGTAHSDRYIVSENIRNWTQKEGFKMFAFYYSPSKWVFKYKQLMDASLKKFDIKKLSFKSLKHTEIINLYRKSKIVLDINHPMQTGLTIRTFEALGAGKKLITTNENVKEYPFYNSNNILIIDRNNIELNHDFFETDFENIPSHIDDKMALKGWIECLFIKEQDKFWNNEN